MTTVLHVHGGQAASPILQPLESSGVVVIDAPFDNGTLPRLARESAADVAVIAGVEWPVRIARTIHEATPEAHIVFVTDETSEPSLRRELLLAPRIGTHWSVTRSDSPAAATATIRSALDSASQRRQLRTTLGKINVRLARQQPAPRAMVSDHFLAAVLHQLSDGVVMIDDAGRVTAFNEAARTIFGAGLVRGTEFASTLPPGGESLGRALDSKADETAAELDLVKNGERMVVEARLTRVRNEQGAAVGTAVLARDVTERRTFDDRQRLLAAASLILSSTLDLEDAMQGLAEFLAEELGGLVAADIVEGDAVVRRGAAIAGAGPEIARRLRDFAPIPTASHPTLQAFRTGEMIVRTDASDEELQRLMRSSEHLQILRDAGIRSFAALPLSARTELIGALLVARDHPYTAEELGRLEDLARITASSIRNIWLYRAAAEGNRSKDEFLATLSHELRTPMTSILGWLQLMRIGDLDEATECDALEAMEQSARIQAQLIDDLLDLSRIQMGKLHMQMTRTDLTAVVRAAVDTIRPAAAAKGVALHVEGTEEAVVSGDASRLQQVMWNLLSNAVKFTERGGSITVMTETSASSARVTVSDTGKGIEAGFLPYAFDRFRQADSAANRRFGGLGLGLAIVRQIVELHGGTAAAESQGEGFGSRFTVTLPLPAGNAPAAEIPSVPLLRGVSVLLVDADPDSADAVAAALRNAGAKVFSERSAAGAIDSIRRRIPDVLISDLGLPDEGGLSLIREVRSTLRVPVSRLPAVAIAVDEADDVSSRVEVLGAGYQRCLRKPVEAADLARAVSDVLRTP